MCTQSLFNALHADKPHAILVNPARTRACSLQIHSSIAALQADSFAIDFDVLPFSFHWQTLVAYQGKLLLLNA